MRVIRNLGNRQLAQSVVQLLSHNFKGQNVIGADTLKITYPHAQTP